MIARRTPYCSASGMGHTWPVLTFLWLPGGQSASTIHSGPVICKAFSVPTRPSTWPSATSAGGPTALVIPACPGTARSLRRPCSAFVMRAMVSTVRGSAVGDG